MIWLAPRCVRVLFDMDRWMHNELVAWTLDGLQKYFLSIYPFHFPNSVSIIRFIIIYWFQIETDRFCSQMNSIILPFNRIQCRSMWKYEFSENKSDCRYNKEIIL